MSGRWCSENKFYSNLTNICKENDILSTFRIINSVYSTRSPMKERNGLSSFYCVSARSLVHFYIASCYITSWTYSSKAANPDMGILVRSGSDLKEKK